MIDCSQIGLVAFDTNGTLYRQRPLRLRVALELVWHSFRRRQPQFFPCCAPTGGSGSDWAMKGVENFEAVLVAETAKVTGIVTYVVAAIVADWMEIRPLRYLRNCRYPAVDSLFAGLRQQGKTIAILSDYPAVAKLRVLGLLADHVVSATEPGVGMLKPSPFGLQRLMAMAGAGREATILIGDRPDRDGEAARRAGIQVLIRAPKPIAVWQAFARFDDPIFAAVLAKAA